MLVHPPLSPQQECNGAIRMYLLGQQPPSIRSHCQAAQLLLQFEQPAAALAAARRGLQLAAQQGGREPYHEALLHLLTLRTLCFGGGGGATVSVATLLQVQVMLDAVACFGNRLLAHSWLFRREHAASQYRSPATV